jgi:RND family efflux transporter MFP subunit
VLRPVRSERVTVAGGVRERSFSGVAEATTMWNGSFKVPGTVQFVNVVVGQAVAQGDVIAELDAYDYELEVQRAEAALRQAEANARNAAASFERIKLLYEDENATLADYDAALAADQSAREAVASAANTVELARRRRSYTTLTAPFPGDVAEVPIDENENVSVGQVVVRMTIGDRRQVSVAIPEAYILDIERGDAVTVTFDALPVRTYEATVDEVGVSSIGRATTFPVSVILARETPEVRAGMAADVTFRFADDAEPSTLSVPLSSVLEDADGNYVFTLEEAAGEVLVARRIGVVVGDTISSETGSARPRIEIVSGLQEGDRVITAGAKRVVDGQRVRQEAGG